MVIKVTNLNARGERRRQRPLFQMIGGVTRIGCGPQSSDRLVDRNRNGAPYRAPHFVDCSFCSEFVARQILARAATLVRAPGSGDTRIERTRTG